MLSGRRHICPISSDRLIKMINSKYSMCLQEDSCLSFVNECKLILDIIVYFISFNLISVLKNSKDCTSNYEYTYSQGKNQFKVVLLIFSTIGPIMKYWHAYFCSNLQLCDLP